MGTCRVAAARAAIDARLLGSFLSAWVLFPSVLLVASLGCGLLVRMAAGGQLSALLVVPVGFALVVAISSFATSYGWLAPFGGPIVAVVAFAGIALEARARGALRRRKLSVGRWIWALLAAAAAFTAVGGPVFLTGAVGWTGYTRIVDIAFQMDFAQHLANAGRMSPPNGNSSYNIVNSKLLGIGYPGGSQATLGAMAKLTATNVAWAYQAFLAFTAAIGALAVFSLLGRITRNGPMRFVGAAVAIQPNVLYGYSLEAGIKELTTAALLLVVAAVLAERLPGEGRRLGAVPLAVATSGAFGAFSIGIAPWLGILLAGGLLVSLVRGPRRFYTLQSWAVFAVVAIVISLPGLITAGKLANVAGSAIGGVVDLGLGNLTAPVSRWSAAGVWLTGDYRFPLVHATSSHVFDVIIVVLAVVGVLAALLRRRWTIVVRRRDDADRALLLHRTQHRVDPVQVVHDHRRVRRHARLRRRRRSAGQPAARPQRARLARGAGRRRRRALRQRADLPRHDASAGRALPRPRGDRQALCRRRAPCSTRYFDEYAEFFLREERGTTIVDPANFDFQVRPGVAPPGMSFGWDLNQLVPSYLQQLPADRPAAQPDRQPRAEQLRPDPAHALLRRVAPHAAVEHGVLPRAAVQPSARAHAGAMSRARRPGPARGPLERRSPTRRPPSRPWRTRSRAPTRSTGARSGRRRSPDTAPGAAEMKLTLPSAGRYSVWLQGSVGRPLTFYIDGKRLSSLGYEERYPNQFLLVDSDTLTAGAHTLRIVRGGGGLHPGDGNPERRNDAGDDRRDRVQPRGRQRERRLRRPGEPHGADLRRACRLRVARGAQAGRGAARRAARRALTPAAPLDDAPASSCRRARIAAPVACADSVRAMSCAARTPRSAASAGSA